MMSYDIKCVGRTVSSIYAETIFINMIRLQDLLAESPSIDIATVINQNLDYIASQFAESSPQKIGSGMFGNAYRLASGRILKITADTAEVTTAMRRRSQVPHLMSYYDIRSITRSDTTNDHYDSDNTRFALLMDAVTPLTGLQRAIWRSVVHSARNTYYDANKSNQDLERMIMPTWADDPTDVPQFSHDIEFYRRVIEQRDGIVRAVRRNNVDPREVHEANVGIDSNGLITIYDMQTKPSYMRFDVGAVRVNRTYRELVDRLPKIILHPTKFDATGIDTPGDPNM